MHFRNWLIGLAMAGVGITSTPALAQLDNRPFQFRNSEAGRVGMSTAGRQAILNQEILGRTPDNLVRRNGVLVDVVEGRGGEAQVRVPGGGAFLPNARPDGFRYRGAAVGVFNTFFMTGGSGGYVPAASGMSHSVTGWTAAVVSDGYDAGPPGNETSSVIAAWTRQVRFLQR